MVSTAHVTSPQKARVKPAIAPKRTRRSDAPERRIGPRPAAVPASPILKWAGGKTRLLPELQKRMPKTYRRYFEPFIGGGAMFFRMAPENAVLGDMNLDLVNVYRCVAWNVEAVIRKLVVLRRDHSEERYYEVRERWNGAGRALPDIARAATFIYLNKTCYNGLWRVNSRGAFNVPIGRYTDPQIFDRDQLRAASLLLQQAELHTGGYAETIESARRGDFVYFDPPYQPMSKTSSFTSYTAGAFDEDSQAELADRVQRLDAMGVHVMVSNSDTPLIRKLYKRMRIASVDCARAINSKAKKRGAVKEVIVTGRG